MPAPLEKAEAANIGGFLALQFVVVPPCSSQFWREALIVKVRYESVYGVADGGEPDRVLRADGSEVAEVDEVDVSVE